MELRQLKYFAASARRRSITQAARECGVTQPALSQQIQKLERELGARLFVRQGQRIALTAAGTRFLPWAERALRAVEQGVSYARDAAAQSQVRLGGVPSLDSTLLPGALSRFSTLYPDIDVSIFESDGSTDFEGMLQRGELDLAIGRLHTTADNLEARLLVSEPIVVIGPPGHPIMSERRVNLRQLEHEWFVTSRAGDGMRERLLQLCHEAGFEPRLSVETTARYDIMREMVQAGRGFAVIPRLAVGHSLTWARIDSPLASAELYLLSLPDDRLSEAAKLLLDFLLESTEPQRSPAAFAE